MKRNFVRSLSALAVVVILCLASLAQKGKPPQPPPPPADPAIAYVAERSWATADLMVMNADGSNKKVLLTGGGYHDPAWSPDSNRIAFCWNSSYSSGIYLVNKDGSGACKAVETVNGCVVAGNPKWSPDGKKILYADPVLPVPGNELILIDAVCNADPTKAIQLTNTVGGDEFDPAWSADGSYIAATRYIRTDDFGNLVSDIVLYDVLPDWSAAVPVENLTESLGKVNFSAPKWAQSSPYTLVATNGDIQLIDVRDPLHPTNLTQTPSIRESWPAWSPFDQKIVYGREDGLWIMNADGSGAKLLAAPPTKRVRLTEPDWRRTP